MRCALNPGDCMWGATVDGNPMDVATPEGMRHDLPRFGILEFDFVVLRPPEVLNAMRREHIVLDVGDAVVHFYATLLHRRITRVGMRSRELWLYPVVNGRPIPSPTCSSGLWQVPPEVNGCHAACAPPVTDFNRALWAQGELRFELAYHCPEEPVGSMQLDQLSQDLQEATSDAERLQMLAAVGEEPSVTAFFFRSVVLLPQPSLSPDSFVTLGPQRHGGRHGDDARIAPRAHTGRQGTPLAPLCPRCL